jgi:hypothetical protein
MSCKQELKQQGAADKTSKEDGYQQRFKANPTSVVMTRLGNAVTCH